MSADREHGRAELHAAAEAIERRALEDAFDAAPASVRQAMGWRIEGVAGALVSIASDVPSILINRTLGLGTDHAATRQSVARICRRYRDAGVNRFFVHVTPEARPDALRQWLAAEGLAPRRRWMKFERDMSPAVAAGTEFRIEEIGAKHGASFGLMVADAFELGAPAAGLFPPLVGRSGWRMYGAFIENELVGTGALFVHAGCGYLDFGATSPAQRGKGVHAAVLAARIEAARNLGCSAVFTITGEEVPGDPQHSYHNIERAGFRAAYLRDKYAPRTVG